VSKLFTLIGIALFGVLLGSYVATMPSGPLPPNLSVEVPSRTGHLVETDSGPKFGELEPEPEDLESRLEIESWGSSRRRLQLDLYRASWGSRWVEEVAVPTLTGPFHAEDDYVCGYRVGISAPVLDTEGTAKPVVDALTGALTSLSLGVTRTITLFGTSKTFNFGFPAVESVDLRFTFGDGYIAPDFKIVLTDQSYIQGTAKLTLASDDGRPRLKVLGRPTTRYGGGAFLRLKQAAAEFGEEFGYEVRWDLPKEEVVRAARESGWVPSWLPDDLTDAAIYTLYLGCGSKIANNALCEEVVADRARAEGRRRALDMVNQLLPVEVAKRVGEEFDQVVSTLNGHLGGLTKPWQPFGSDGGVTVAFRLSEAPAIDPTGIRVALCMKWTAEGIEAPSPDVPGAPLFDGEGEPFELSGERPVIRVRASTDALNHLLWGLWRAGKLQEWGELSHLMALFAEDESQRQDLNRFLQSLVLEVTGFDPRLPPVLATSRASDDELILTVANAIIGTAEDRTVRGHVEGGVTVSQVGDEVRLGLRVRRVAANCSEPAGNSVTLTPCFSDLLPPLREQLAQVDKTVSLQGSEVLMKIPVLEFKGMRMALSDLQVETVRPGPALDIEVVPRFGGGE